MSLPRTGHTKARNDILPFATQEGDPVGSSCEVTRDRGERIHLIILIIFSSSEKMKGHRPNHKPKVPAACKS